MSDTADAARVSRWIGAREPAPPASLAARVGALYVATSSASLTGGAPTADGCVAAAERTVGALIADGATDRASALDLLAADALATYAFEVASARPETLGALADAAMRRFAALAAPDAEPSHGGRTS